jgi:AcrR family transcriptional regulator
MNISTRAALISAAARLLDAGGESAVTLRAVAKIVGVSHNAPYRHFKNRDALLAGVAENDFVSLTRTFRNCATDQRNAEQALRAAVAALIAYGRKHPARYSHLFSDPSLASAGGEMEVAAREAFRAFGELVDRYKGVRLQSIDTLKLAGLIYATLHGCIDLERGGRARDAKGLGNIETTIDLLFMLLASKK